MNGENHQKAVVYCPKVLALVCGAIIWSLSAFAQQQIPAPQASPAAAAKWVNGPGKANVGNLARINIPEGFRFVDQNGARLVLERMNNPVPKNLVGLLAPNSASWFAVLEFSDIGYVQDNEKDALDPKALLETIRRTISRQIDAVAPPGGNPISSVDWELQPQYDSAGNKLEWAIKAGNADESTVNYAVRFLGRRGVLDLVVVQPYKAGFDLGPLRQIAGNIEFQNGERYADFQAGDRVSKYGLAALAANETEGSRAGGSGAGETVAAASGFGRQALLGGIGFAVVAAGLGVYFLKRRGPRPVRRSVPASAAAAESMEVAPVGVAANDGEPVTNGNGHGVAPAKPAAVPVAQRNGKSSKHHERRRQKVFRYDSFYSDMVMKLTSLNYGLEAPAEEGAEQTNGYGYPSSQPQRNGQPSSRQGQGQEQGAFALEAAKLIESQQKLIDGYRRLIEEQNKLIEEKTKLIDVESKMLEKQQELLSEQQLL